MTTPHATKRAPIAWPLQRGEPESVGMCSQRLSRVGELMQRYVGEGRVPGVLTLAARRGKIAHLECFGNMDLEKGKPMHEDAIFRIYSMSKIVTSVAVLMLMEEGRYKLTDPVCGILPEFKSVRVAVKGADGQEELVRPRRDVTIHDLLTHTGGLTYEAIHEAQVGGLSLKAFVEEMVKRPLRHQPGEVWDYSASVDVLGRLVEVVAGQPFDAFLQERVFAPLGMTDTAFWVPPEKADRLAWIYETGPDGKLVSCEDRVKSPYLKAPSLPSGGGGLVSTTCDYLRFSLMLLGKGELDDVRLLGRKSVELMADDHLPAGHGPVDANDRGFGLGVSVLRRLGETRQIGSVGEFGWGGAACTQVWIDPAEELVTMIMLQYRPKTKYTFMDLFKATVYQSIVD
jgi:CubicO group peptidase (beta-lactamase class C family)